MRKNPNSNLKFLRNDEAHIDFVKKNVSVASKVLDFGPGVGRIFPAYTEAKSIMGYDITNQHKHTLVERARKLSLDFDLVSVERIEKHLPFREDQFDIAVCVSVLLHQRPINLINTMSELGRVSKKCVVISLYDRSQKFCPLQQDGTNSHVYNYDYKKICKENKWKIISWHDDKIRKQAFFTYEKNSFEDD